MKSELHIFQAIVIVFETLILVSCSREKVFKVLKRHRVRINTAKIAPFWSRTRKRKRFRFLLFLR